MNGDGASRQKGKSKEVDSSSESDVADEERAEWERLMRKSALGEERTRPKARRLQYEE